MRRLGFREVRQLVGQIIPTGVVGLETANPLINDKGYPAVTFLAEDAVAPILLGTLRLDTVGYSSDRYTPWEGCAAPVQEVCHGNIIPPSFSESTP